MTIYLASCWENLAEMPAVAARLQAQGHTVTSTWWRRELREYMDRSEEARVDLDELDEAEAFVVYTVNGDRTRGGMNFEAGYACARDKDLYRLGPAVNIFLERYTEEWPCQ